MILISHRGNLSGKNDDKENHPDYIQTALDKGYDVEVDVWYTDGKWYLGHDAPTYKIKLDYLKNNNLWCHAKNIDALNGMLKKRNIHCFWHQEDDVTLTSKGVIWTYPGKPLTDNSICVLLEKNNEFPKKCLGICSDFVVTYKN